MEDDDLGLEELGRKKKIQQKIKQKVMKLKQKIIKRNFKTKRRKN